MKIIQTMAVPNCLCLVFLTLILAIGLSSANRVLTAKDQETYKPDNLGFEETLSWGGDGNFGIGQGSGNLGFDTGLGNGAGREGEVVRGGGFGVGISWPSFGAGGRIEGGFSWPGVDGNRGSNGHTGSFPGASGSSTHSGSGGSYSNGVGGGIGGGMGADNGGRTGNSDGGNGGNRGSGSNSGSGGIGAGNNGRSENSGGFGGGTGLAPSNGDGSNEGGGEPAIGGGSGSSSVGGGGTGSRPSISSGGGSGSNENTIPALGPFGQALYCTPVNCPNGGACGGFGVYFDYHFNWPNLHRSASATKATDSHDSQHNSTQGFTNMDNNQD